MVPTSTASTPIVETCVLELSFAACDLVDLVGLAGVLTADGVLMVILESGLDAIWNIAKSRLLHR